MNNATAANLNPRSPDPQTSRSGLRSRFFTPQGNPSQGMTQEIDAPSPCQLMPCCIHTRSKRLAVP